MVGSAPVEMNGSEKLAAGGPRRQGKKVDR
jgi:hypothetical protein